jgi:polysaccharide export outer membrane protein
MGTIWSRFALLCLLNTLLLMLPAVAAARDAAAQSPGQGDYVLAAGDVIEVRVYGEDDLTTVLTVPTDGTVEYAFVGEFKLTGNNVNTVQREIYQRLLGDYLTQPRVSVTVLSYREFYISGEVAKPGAYSWQPGLTVRKALTLAGGLRERASTSKWFLVHEGGSEKDRHKVAEDDPINPGDSLSISQSFF